MLDEYEFYQGAVLRQLIARADWPLIVRPFEREGRINAFVLSARIGVFIKHSTKRMSPWTFTFHLEHAGDLLNLVEKYFDSFVIFVCGKDGLVTLDMAALHEIVSFNETESAWIRIARKPRSMYAVSGNRGDLSYKVARGTELILEKMKSKTRELKFE